MSIYDVGGAITTNLLLGPDPVKGSRFTQQKLFHHFWEINIKLTIFTKEFT